MFYLVWLISDKNSQRELETGQNIISNLFYLYTLTNFNGYCSISIIKMEFLIL